MASRTPQWPIVFVLGPPGAGKSYFCRRAAQVVSSIEHVVMSDLLRREAQRPTSPFAKEINSKLQKGILVSSDAAVASLRSYLKALSDDKSRRILLDGFPRNLDQAQKFRQEIGEVMGTVVLTCREDIALRRLEQRNRDDNDVATAKHRLQSHREETVPMIEDYLSEMDRPVRKVDSNRDDEQGWVEFRNVLSEILKSDY